MEGPGVSYHTSGDVPLAMATVRTIVHDQLRSIAWALVGVAVLLLVVNRNLRFTMIQLPDRISHAAATGGTRAMLTAAGQ